MGVVFANSKCAQGATTSVLYANATHVPAPFANAKQTKPDQPLPPTGRQRAEESKKEDGNKK